jgi:hypothetical protein
LSIFLKNVMAASRSCPDPLSPAYASIFNKGTTDCSMAAKPKFSIFISMFPPVKENISIQAMGKGHYDRKIYYKFVVPLLSVAE